LVAAVAAGSAHLRNAMSRPLSVLVVCEDAAEYPPLLASLTAAGVGVNYASSAAATLQHYQGENILLAQPDMAAAIIDQLPSVQWIQSTWAGVTPLLRTQRQDYLLTGVKGVFDAPMAEYSLGYLLAHEQKLLWRYQQQQDRQWRDKASGRLAGKTLGVMGTGSIGAHIARSARGLGLQVLGYSRSGVAVSDFAEVFSQQKLNDFLSRSDYVVAVLPDTPETTGLMNARSFAAMKSSALFINIGRGNLVDEPALVDALRAGQIAAAVLDVFRTEPLPPESPLWSAPNLLITAHVAARSWPEDSAGIFLDNFRRYQQQLELKFVIDRGRGY